MSALHPSPGALDQAGASLDPQQPVVMVNLLRFAERAGYEDATECSGEEAYRTYSRHTWPLLKGVEGEVVYHGEVRGMIISPSDEHWDEVLIVRYPAYSAFLSMITSEAYRSIVHHRTAALADSRLMATQSDQAQA